MHYNISKLLNCGLLKFGIFHLHSNFYLVSNGTTFYVLKYYNNTWQLEKKIDNIGPVENIVKLTNPQYFLFYQTSWEMYKINDIFDIEKMWQQNKLNCIWPVGSDQIDQCHKIILYKDGKFNKVSSDQLMHVFEGFKDLTCSKCEFVRASDAIPFIQTDLLPPENQTLRITIGVVKNISNKDWKNLGTDYQIDKLLFLYIFDEQTADINRISHFFHFKNVPSLLPFGFEKNWQNKDGGYFILGNDVHHQSIIISMSVEQIINQKLMAPLEPEKLVNPTLLNFIKFDDF